MIRRIPSDEVVLVKPPGRDRADWSPTLAPSLGAALDYFVLATAARLARGHEDFSSMLSPHDDVHRCASEHG